MPFSLLLSYFILIYSNLVKKKKVWTGNLDGFLIHSGQLEKGEEGDISQLSDTRRHRHRHMTSTWLVVGIIYKQGMA